MWKSYLTVALRALFRHRTYAFINIFGLALSLIGCLLIILYVQYERSYDRFLPNAENTYQLQNSYSAADTGEVSRLQMTSYVSGRLLREGFPQIDKMVYALSNWPVALRNGEAVTVRYGLFVDGPFFDMLRFPFVQGDPRTALSEVGYVVLTESEALRLFGSENPVGQTMTLMVQGRAVDHRVTGIVRDPPRNSHVRFNLVARFDPASHFADTPDFLTGWGWQEGWYYLTLRPGADPAAIHAAMPAWERRDIPTEQVGGTSFNAGESRTGTWSTFATSISGKPRKRR